MVKKADEKMKRGWAEVSGPAEKLAQSTNTKPIPNKFASYLTDKEILNLNPDGYHYTRLIMGEPHEKIIYGFIGLTPEQEKELKNKGLDIQDLPQ
jgi:murein tripeptide amidase MpaA